MTTYTFYDGSIAGTQKVNHATPGDLNTMFIRRGYVDTTKQNLANADVARAIPVYDGEIVCSVGYRVKTAEGTANAKVDVTLGDSGTTWGTDQVVTPANTVVSNFLSVRANADTNICLIPTNGVAIDAGIFEVFAVITKGFDKM